MNFDLDSYTELVPGSAKIISREKHPGTWSQDENGEIVFYDFEKRQWVYEDQRDVVCIGGKKKKVCAKCEKPQMDINGIINCDFCLQGLTNCDFISDACCGHGDDDNAYIALKDDRVFILDQR